MIEVNHLCPGCMGPWEDTGKPCPRCGFSWETVPAGGRELPPFTILAGRYLLGNKIGVGGFGVTYIAMDLVQEQVAAIKEFFPASLASRAGTEVKAPLGEEGRYFREALRSFRREAELLSRFSEVPGIVSYRDYVTENGTAYLVMNYVEGTSLSQHMRRTGRTFSEQEALTLMRPILLAVEAMHGNMVLHRDISPENLILKPDGTLTLIDFGAAREYSLEEEENLTVILKHGYAPEEQYHSGSRQGPWTDLYACCAVLYQMVSGILPQDAAGRREKDDLLPLDEIEGLAVTERFARVIEKGMTIRATERYPSIRALMTELYAGYTYDTPQSAAGNEAPAGYAGQAAGAALLGAAEQAKVRGTAPQPYQTAEPAYASQGETTGERLYTPPEAGAYSRDVAYSQERSEQEGTGRKRGFAIAAAAVAALLVCLAVAFLLWPRGSSEDAVADGGDESYEDAAVDVYAEDGLVWMITGWTDEDSGAQYWYEYNEQGCYSRVTSYGVSEHSYANMQGGSYAMDSSYGEIVSDFSYEYDKKGRIVSCEQTTDTGMTYRHEYVYQDYPNDIPAEIKFLSDSGECTWYLDEDGLFREAEVIEGAERIKAYFEQTEGSCTTTERIYCVNPDDKEELEQFIYRYDGDIQGVDYEISEDGELLSWEVTGDVYAESVLEMPSNAGWPASAYLMYRPYYPGSDDDSTQDEYGNVLESSWGIYSYAEYEVKDGVYTPTGRTSGTLPEFVDETEEAVGFGVQNNYADDSVYLPNIENPASYVDDETQQEIMDLMEYYGIGYVTWEEDIEKMRENEDKWLKGISENKETYCLIGANLDSIDIQFIEDLNQSNELLLANDSLQINDSDKERLIYEYVVLPPEQWFLADGSIWTIVTADMDLCWEISEHLLEEGYYPETGVAAGFLYQLDEYEGNAIWYRESNPIRYAIFKQYLEYWGEKTGIEWTLTNPETGESVGNR